LRILSGMKRLALLLPLLLLAACRGHDLARASLYGPGTANVPIVVSTGRVVFWTQWSASFDTAAGVKDVFKAHYDVELDDGAGKAIARTTCDPRTPNEKLGGNNGRKNAPVHRESWEGRMSCDVTVPKGPYTLHVTFVIDERPLGLVIEDASLMARE